MKRKQYKMICQTCGKVFFSSRGRINCDACMHKGRAQKVVEQLKLEAAHHNLDGAIFDCDVSSFADRGGCNFSYLKVLLQKSGYKRHTVYIKDKEDAN